MTKLLLLTSIFLLNISLFASEVPQKHIKPLSDKQIERMDKRFTKHKAKKRKFHTRKAFIKHHRYYPKARYTQSSPKKYHQDLYDEQLIHLKDDSITRQRANRYPKRGWELAYRYDRAAFFDRFGYHYGYFNRHGYYFEGIFYHYDRGYRYRDRVKGKGLFDHRYYMPADAEYYGFSYQSNRRF